MKLKIPGGDFRAYLFDCDGTIADSMPLHYVAWKRALGEWNCAFDEKLFYEWGGMPVVEIVATLNQRRGLNMPVETVARRKENLYFELLPQLKAVPEVLEHMEAKHGPGSVCCRLRQRARFGPSISHDTQPSRPV